MWAWQFSKALHLQRAHGWARFVTMQDHYNLLHREEEREMLPLCADEGIGVIPWSPLARGRLTRDWEATTARSETDAFGRTLYAEDAGDAEIAAAVAAVAAERGVPRAQVALAWVLRAPGRHRADRRREQARPPGGRRRGARARAHRRRGRGGSRSRTRPHAVAGF